MSGLFEDRLSLKSRGLMLGSFAFASCGFRVHWLGGLQFSGLSLRGCLGTDMGKNVGSVCGI